MTLVRADSFPWLALEFKGSNQITGRQYPNRPQHRHLSDPDWRDVSHRPISSKRWDGKDAGCIQRELEVFLRFKAVDHEPQSKME